MFENFDTTRNTPERESGSEIMRAFKRFRPQVVVSVVVVVLLLGGALYSARITERAPQVVYTASLSDIADEVNAPLLININTADAEELDELPEVGPSTAEAIVAYRLSNGRFEDVEELEEIPGIGPSTIEQISPFATV